MRFDIKNVTLGQNLAIWGGGGLKNIHILLLPVLRWLTKGGEGVPRGYVIDRFPKFQKSVIFRNRSKWGILSVFDPQNDVFMCFEPFLVPKIPCGAFTTAKSSIFWHSGPKMCNFVSWTSCWDRNIWFCGVMKPHTSQKSGQKCSKSENLRGWRNPTESHTSPNSIWN